MPREQLRRVCTRALAIPGLPLGSRRVMFTAQDRRRWRIVFAKAIHQSGVRRLRQPYSPHARAPSIFAAPDSKFLSRDVTPMVLRLRLIKDAYEKDATRRAARESAEGMAALMSAVTPGMNDLDAAGAA